MKVLLLTILLLIPQFKYYKFGKPTPKGVDKWIEMHQWDLGEEYERVVQDTLYDYFISADDLTDYVGYDSAQLGFFFLPSEAIVHNKANFIDYAVDSLSNFKRKITNSNAFVKGTVFHELTHVYVNQILREMDYRNEYISPEYRNFRVFSSRESNFGAEFVEEGVCEYVSLMAGEILYRHKPDKPGSIEEINGSYQIKYLYAEFFIREFLRIFDRPKEGIKILLSHPPPSREEMLNPSKYYERLNKLN